MKKLVFLFLILSHLLYLNTLGQYRQSYLQLGHKELVNENYHKAIEYFTHYIKNHPGLFNGYYLRGLAKFYLDDLNGSENDFSQAISRLPQFPQLYLMRGIVRSQNFQLQQAIDDFCIAIHNDSLFTGAYFYRSLTQLNLNNIDSALKDINRVIQIDSTYLNAHILRGVIHSDLGNYQEAIHDLTISLTQGSDKVKALIERGKVYTKMNETDNALSDFNKVLYQDSVNTQALLNRGLAYMQNLEYEKALNDLNRVIEISPDNELAYFNRAAINNNQNNSYGAIDDYLEILNRNPDNLLVYYNMGISFASLGRYEQAIKSFSYAINIYPDYPDAYLQRSLASKELGNLKAAEKDFGKYELLQQNNTEKPDSVKYTQGMELLRLSHLVSDFISEEEKEKRLQYMESKIDLKPPYQMVVDSLFFQDNLNFNSEELSYYVKSSPLNEPVNNGIIYYDMYHGILDSLKIHGLPGYKYYQLLGIIYYQRGQLIESIQAYDTAVTFRPNNVSVLLNRSNARMADLNTLVNKLRFQPNGFSGTQTIILRMYSDITHDLNKILHLQPDFIHARYNLAYLKFITEDYMGALEEFDRVTKKNKLAEAHYNKALLLHYYKRNDEACKELSIAGELGLKDAYPALRKLCK